MQILFIINPISGSGLGKKVPAKILKMSEYQDIKYDIKITEYAGHARLIVEEARKSGNYTHIIAVGGDGTVNEVGSSLYGSDIIMGIISLGSGNGFARHLGYSMSMEKALKQVLVPVYAQIDMLEINGVYSLNVSGVGFDGEVAHEFSHSRTRGMLSYIRAGLKTWFRYSGKDYTIKYNDQMITARCFILSFANSSQYGNNAKIAPHASLRDGLMDICLLQRPRPWSVIPFLYCLQNGKLDKLNFYKGIQCEEAVVEGDIHHAHIDGEAVVLTSPVRLKVHKGVLKVIVPKFAG